MSQISRYVMMICGAALLALFFVYRLAPDVNLAFFQAAVFFAVLGFLGNCLAHNLPSGAVGSISFIPFLTAIVVAPNWLTVSMVTLVTVIDGVMVRRATIKTIFNAAQALLATSLAIIVYRYLGGQPFLTSGQVSVGPYTLLVVVFLIVNTLSVSGAIATSEGKSVWHVWRVNTLNTVAYDLMSIPVAYAFATVYLKFGPMWAAALAVPILGLRQLYTTNWQLERVNQELLELMVAAIEARDPYTSGHSRRVSRFAKVIARAIGLKSREVERVGIAALLHDVGKIFEIYAPILRKPDRLTAEEQVIMQTHPIKSAELVQNVSQLKDVVVSIRHHHENWDGTGYPDGIAGDEIPLTSRIIMVADTIDAMTTDRPYRRALTQDDVRVELIRMRGRQFDPRICDLLVNSPIFDQLFTASPTQNTPLQSPTVSILPMRRAGGSR